MINPFRLLMYRHPSTNISFVPLWFEHTYETCKSPSSLSEKKAFAESTGKVALFH